jgi:lipopolysaccharide export system protein LptA
MFREKLKLMKNKIKKLILIFTTGFFCIAATFAEKITFSAQIMSGKTGGSDTATILEGDAYIKTSSIEIKANSIELSGDNYRFIKAEGKVSGSSIESKMDFDCESLSFDRTTNIATLTGNVNLTDNANDVKANAQVIEYNQATGLAILQIKVNLTQKNNVCTASYAVYQQNKQLLELSGNAQVKQGQDTFRAQMITLNLETQDITLDGNVKGSITEQKSDDSQNQETPPSDENAPSAPQAENPPAESESGEKRPVNENSQPKTETSEKSE